MRMVKENFSPARNYKRNKIPKTIHYFIFLTLQNLRRMLLTIELTAYWSLNPPSEKPKLETFTQKNFFFGISFDFRNSQKTLRNHEK